MKTKRLVAIQIVPLPDKLIIDFFRKTDLNDNIETRTRRTYNYLNPNIFSTIDRATLLFNMLTKNNTRERIMEKLNK